MSAEEICSPLSCQVDLTSTLRGTNEGSIVVDTDIPLVISCQGGTPAAQLAADVAAALEQLDAAEAASDFDSAVTAARAGRQLIALDGCRSACCTRMLETKDVRPQAALDVTELRERTGAADDADPARLAEKAVSCLQSRRRAAPQPRHPRPLRPAPVSRTKRAHTVDDYLLALDALASTTVECGALAAQAPTLAAHVSRLLGVSRASAGEMLARIEQAGLVERSARKELSLTDEGRAAADRAVRRHRLLERFVHDVLGYPSGACYERARLLEDAFDDDAVERLCAALHDPDRCPHGWPIDAALARAESRELAVLTALAEGEQATVVRVAEQDARVVDRLHELGAMPGAAVTVAGRSPRGSLTVDVDGTARTVDAPAAGAVLVRR